MFEEEKDTHLVDELCCCLGVCDALLLEEAGAAQDLGICIKDLRQTRDIVLCKPQRP